MVYLFILTLAASLLATSFIGREVVRALGRKQEALDRQRVTYGVTFPTDVAPEQVVSFIYALGGVAPRGMLQTAVPTTVFEVVAEDGVIRHRLRIPSPDSAYVIAQLVSAVPGLDYQPIEVSDTDWQPTALVDLAMSAPDRMLQIADTADLSSRILSSMQGTRDGETIVLQWVITPTSRNKLPQPGATSTKFNLVDSLLGLNFATSDEVSTRRSKLNEQNYLVAGRIAASSLGGAQAAEARVGFVLRALRAESGPHTSIKAKWQRAGSAGEQLALASTPNQMRMQMTATELTAALAWPLGKGYVAGLARRYTRHFPVPEVVPRDGIVIGRSTLPGSERKVALTPGAMIMHAALFGSNGTGKTTVAVGMAEQLIAGGHGLLVLEADGDLITRVLAHVPPHRLQDVIVLDYADDTNFVGLNYLDLESPEHVASRLVTIFESIYENQSINTRVLLGHALRAIGSVPGSTIADLPTYLNPTRRDDVVWARHIDDSITDVEVRSFMKKWRSDMGGRNREGRLREFEPVYRRLYELLLPVQSRYMLNQPTSAFNPRDALEQNKIVLVNLKGVPETVASVVGSMLVGIFWDSAKTIRPALANFMLIDECHMFTKIDGLVIDALATARKRNLGLVLATQYPERLSRDLRYAIGTNARTQLTFTCGPEAAGVLANQFGDRNVNKELLQNLEQFNAVGRVMTEQGQSPVLSLKTIPEADGYGLGERAVWHSNARYAKSKAQVDQEVRATRGVTEQQDRDGALGGDEPIEPFDSEG
ncbi:type IV secretory system conjugative DNA transfer family protein [Tsukamurella spumae]|uniref:ATP-binding protein n=1 Tax=Tsukamurella spumae TaxID=44753 RepID=A0A846X128_9ACTN|nr:DUF87 domain-containing protein [Tsukamurella spumae]NKY18893.1 ATP-binding protein [Tsukamurella spumae]